MRGDVLCNFRHCENASQLAIRSRSSCVSLRLKHALESRILCRETRSRFLPASRDVSGAQRMRLARCPSMPMRRPRKGLRARVATAFDGISGCLRRARGDALGDARLRSHLSAVLASRCVQRSWWARRCLSAGGPLAADGRARS